MKKPDPLKFPGKGSENGAPLTLFLQRAYKVVNRTRSVFGTLVEKISDQKIVLLGRDGRNRIVRLYHDSKIFNMNKKKSKKKGKK